MAGLSPEIKALVEFSPAEEVVVEVLRERLIGCDVQFLIQHDQSFPFITVRRSPTMGQYQGDSRFTDWAEVTVNAFCSDPNGDQDAALLAEAVRVVLRDAAVERKVYPGLGHITRAELISAPRRAADWATATGPVQYADLPTGTWRYEARYEIEIRKSTARPFPLPTP
jgi:hypothetical protein